VPVPDRAKGTELMIRDTIWSDRANPEKYVPYKVPAHANGGEVIDYNLADIEDIIYDYNYSIKANKTPLYSPELTDEELKALLSYRKGEYFTDEEMYNYMNELIIRLHKDEIYDNEHNATVSNT
jgi:hypothetical protein